MTSSLARTARVFFPATSARSMCAPSTWVAPLRSLKRIARTTSARTNRSVSHLSRSPRSQLHAFTASSSSSTLSGSCHLTRRTPHVGGNSHPSHNPVRRLLLPPRTSVVAGEVVLGCELRHVAFASPSDLSCRGGGSPRVRAGTCCFCFPLGPQLSRRR